MRYRIAVVAAVLFMGCASTLALRDPDGQMMTYERGGLGEISPMEVGSTVLTMSQTQMISAQADFVRAQAEVMRARPELFFWRYSYGWYGGYGGYGGWVDPGYYYPGIRVRVIPENTDRELPSTGGER